MGETYIRSKLFEKMKYLFLLLPLLIVSCNTISGEVNTTNTEDNFKEEYFFNFNKVDYYSISSENDLGQVLMKDTLSKIDKFYLSVLNDNNHSEIGFVDSLEMIGYVKVPIQKAKVRAFTELFKSRKVEEWEMSSCEPIYRDILVFRNEANVVGVAKICFSCEQHFIIGSNFPTESFGQAGEFQELLELLGKS